jgi:hypothetical protein
MQVARRRLGGEPPLIGSARHPRGRARYFVASRCRFTYSQSRFVI